jgi:two-component system, NtrC family, sensor kinase
MRDYAKIEVFYNIFREVSKLVHSSSSMNEVMEVAVWKATEALQAKGALLRILNLDSEELELSAAYGLSESYLAKGPVSQKKLFTDVYHQNQIIIIDDVQDDPRVQYPREAEQEGISMIVDAPLKFRDHIAGILRIFFSRSRPVSKDERDFLVSLTDQCACAIEKARLIEEQKNRYDQLALHTEKLSALGRMAAGIAHEINNPLAGILLYSSNLYKKVPREGPLKEGFEIIMRETQRCKVIIQDLLEFARDKEPKKSRADVTPIIEKSLSMLENEFRLQHIQIEKHLSPHLSEIYLDTNQMQQVFVNLLLNAAQAIEENGTITVRSRMDPAREHIVIDIIDSGCGIPAEHLSRIFEPFFSTKKNGSGLGLAVSYGIVKNHQGQLEVSSRPGKGARFTVTLPVIKESSKFESHACGTCSDSDHR